VWEVAAGIHENEQVDSHREAIGGQGRPVCDKRITTDRHNQIWGAERQRHDAGLRTFWH
jgi:hypothetical protein